MNNKEPKKNLIIKLAEKIGKDSVGKCGVWFNQPVVPAKLNNKGKS
ncbi:MAG: AgrD family cyclic lactone autoinducer peptide [Anaeroplasmataceae bacterium]